MSARTCAIIQSSYIPWRGYFDLINKADVFVFLDSVQFTKQDWRTRNQIKTERGLIWLSIPVLWRGNRTSPIAEIVIDDSKNWRKKHLATIGLSYARAPYREEVMELITPIYNAQSHKLFDFNRQFTTVLWNFLSGNNTKEFVGDEELELPEATNPNERVIEICKKVGADRYLSGPTARAYLDSQMFAAAGIELDYIDYNYEEYVQLHGGFAPNVSIIDTLMCLGGGSLEQTMKVKSTPL